MAAQVKIAEIEIIPIFPKLARRYEGHEVRMEGIDHRVVYRARTDCGLTGCGDLRIRPGGCPPRSSIEPLIGRDPFDFINNRFNAGLGGALYDLMGKKLGVPAYKLMGQKVRDRVSVAAWTRPAAPDEFAKEIQRAADEGYRIFKMHSCDYHDVIEQTRAAEAVAPPGFELHWDFNANRTLATVLPLVARLERDHPIVGYIEDPIARTDIDGWRRLREQTRIPIVMHVPQLGGAQEMLHGLADIYMLDGGVGDTLERGWMYSRANVQTIIQQGAGTLGKAFALHMAAVLPSASGHSIHLDDQYEEDYTTTRIPVTEGFSPVPSAPGLGFEVDEDALARMAAREAPAIPRHVGVLTLPGGTKVYTSSIPSAQEITGREEGSIRGLSCELWQDDGSDEFERAFGEAHA